MCELIPCAGIVRWHMASLAAILAFRAARLLNSKTFIVSRLLILPLLPAKHRRQIGGLP